MTCLGTLEVVIEEVLWSIRRSYQYVVLLSGMWHNSGARSYTMTRSIRYYTNTWLYYWLWPFTEFDTSYRIPRCFYGAYARGVACRKRTLTPPRIWSWPILDLHNNVVILSKCLRLMTVFPKLVMFTEFGFSNIPKYFYLTYY